MALFVVDASIACKAVVAEDGSDLAHALFAGRDRLVAPSYLLIECANALRKKVAGRYLDRAAAVAAYDDLVGLPFELVPVTSTLTRGALELALSIGHPAQDCLYLALARERTAQVVSDDAKFIKTVRRHRDVSKLILSIAETAR
jgi:predicted nucleic acid-binding protein